MALSLDVLKIRDFRLLLLTAVLSPKLRRTVVDANAI